MTLCELFGGELVVVYAGKELGYSVFGKTVPKITQADEKTINFSIDELLNNPTNPSHKLSIDTCMSEIQ